MVDRQVLAVDRRHDLQMTVLEIKFVDLTTPYTPGCQICLVKNQWSKLLGLNLFISTGASATTS